MCLIALSLNGHQKYRLVFAANRDEFYDRPAEPLHRWDTNPAIWAGRDLQADGTWLAISETGRVAAVTNVREIGRHQERARSRGEIPLRYVLGKSSAPTFLRKLQARGEAYNGFNVLAGSPEELWYASNRVEGEPLQLSEGIQTLSNASLTTRWHKTERAKSHLHEILARDEVDEEDLFELLKDATLADPNDLPETGLSPERERAASSIFIQTQKYGTRCSTVVLVDRSGRVRLVERTYDRHGESTQTKRVEFEVAPDVPKNV